MEWVDYDGDALTKEQNDILAKMRKQMQDHINAALLGQPIPEPTTPAEQPYRDHPNYGTWG